MFCEFVEDSVKEVVLVKKNVRKQEYMAFEIINVIKERKQQSDDLIRKKCFEA